jgi:hypothetical protein
LFHFINILFGYFTTCQSLDYITFYSTMNEELETIWKEAVVVCRVIIPTNVVTRKGLSYSNCNKLLYIFYWGFPVNMEMLMQLYEMKS